MIEITRAFTDAYPDACAGILVMRGVANPSGHDALNARKNALEADIRGRFGNADRATIRTIEPIQAYNAYYKRFRKTYHVQGQVESVALKGKPIPSVAALVEAMFMAELKNMLLTAGHDLSAVKGSVKLDVSSGQESYTTISGHDQQMKAGDMMFTDSEGVISSVVYGPDSRTSITKGTTDVMFAVYAPSGITRESVASHLNDIRDFVHVVSPDASVDLIEVFPSA